MTRVFKCPIAYDTRRSDKADISGTLLFPIGWRHGARDHITEDGRAIRFSKAGCSYEEWLNGAEPKPVRELYCPYLWTEQRMIDEGHPAHKLYAHCAKLRLGERITNCAMYPHSLETCWDIYDRLVSGRAELDAPDANESGEAPGGGGEA